MSKSDKHLKIISPTEIKQAPLIQETPQTKSLKKKANSPPTKVKHKHNYQITSIERCKYSFRKGENVFENCDNEYFSIDLKCSICDKVKHEWKRIFIDDWNKNYKDTYEKLHEFQNINKDNIEEVNE